MDSTGACDHQNAGYCTECELRKRAETAERSAAAWEADALLREKNRADQQARAERAEAALAEMRERDHVTLRKWIESSDRRVRAEALREAADRIDAGKCRGCAAIVRAMADERGGR